MLVLTTIFIFASSLCVIEDSQDFSSYLKIDAGTSMSGWSTHDGSEFQGPNPSVKLSDAHHQPQCPSPE